MLKNSTINDIAKQLGVSNALVSFVLNGKNKEMRISDKMTSKVLALAEKMNYTPNYFAQSLKKGTSSTLGLIVADISNSFFAKIARYIETEALHYGYQVIFSNSDENLTKFAQQLQVLKNRKVDGLILTPPAGSDVINIIPELFNMEQREKGFIDALRNNGISINQALIKHFEFNHIKEHITEAIRDIIQNKADAVLFASNKIGVLGLECMLKLGVNIPDDISVISFDETLEYRLSSTPITAVTQPLEQMSKEAVRILINTIEDKYIDGQYESIELDADFVYRKSCL